MPLTFKARCLCEWVQESNGIVKAGFMPPFNMADHDKQPAPILINVPKECGVPRIGEPYFIDIQPAFPRG